MPSAFLPVLQQEHSHFIIQISFLKKSSLNTAENTLLPIEKFADWNSTGLIFLVF